MNSFGIVDISGPLKTQELDYILLNDKLTSASALLRQDSKTFKRLAERCYRAKGYLELDKESMCVMLFLFQSVCGHIQQVVLLSRSMAEPAILET